MAPAFSQDVAANAGSAGEARFDVLEFVVEGNTVLATVAVERAVYPHLGEQRTLADVEAAAAALQKVYRDAGYGNVTVDIPEQRVDGGVIALRVVEGRIARTRVTGSRWFSQGYILDKVSGAEEGSVPHFPTLQAQLGHVNRTADRRVSPLLRPGADPGTTELDLVVQDQLPLHGSVGLNNAASANTSKTRLSASLRYDNLWQRDHSLGLQAVMSPENRQEVQVLSASYSLPMGAVGQDSLAFSVTQSDSEVAAGVAGTQVLGKGRIWGLRRTVMLDLRPPGSFHMLTLSADYKDFDETVSASDGQGQFTPIRYLPLGLSYLGSVSDSGDAAGGRWQFGAGLSAGLRGLVNKPREFAEKRYMASGGYTIFKLDLGREQPLPWWGSSVRARVDGQWASEPLVSNEQFIAGGADSVRGYLESAVAGDHGIRSSIEWRSADLAPTLHAWGLPKPLLNQLALLVFAEGAFAEVRQPLPGQQRRFGIAGAGFGLRARAAGISLNLDLAWPLRDLASTQRGEPRLHAAGLFEF